MRINFNSEIAEELKKLGADVYKCYQCGTCTGDCPVAQVNPTFNPRKIMLLASFGVDSILESNIAWLCSTCYKCTSLCPRDVKPSEVLGALRNLSIARNEDNTGTRLAKNFAEIIKNYGILSEVKLAIKLKGIVGSARMLPSEVAWKMLRKGKVSTPKSPAAGEVKKIFEMVE